MGSEAEPEPSSTPKLPLFLIPPMQSPERSGMLTPPLQTSASVPFRWEEEPGKPRPCTALTICNPNDGGPKCLDLPPRLLIMESKITKTPSPTTVLDGPYVGVGVGVGVGRSLFQSSSFRFRSRESQGGLSFRGDHGSSCRMHMSPPQRGHLGTMVLSKRGGFFGSWGQRTLKLRGGKKEGGGDTSFVYSSSSAVDMPASASSCGAGEESCSSARVKKKMTSIRRNGSFSTPSQARSHLWAAIYKGVKQAIPWSRKSKKQELII